MEKFLFRPAIYERLYNCSYMNTSGWTSFAMPRPILGSICIGIGCINLLAYGLCLPIVWKPMFFRNSCFKIMFFLGVLDSICIVGSSIVTGCLHLSGTVFCLAPNLQYICGCALVGCWFGECFGCALLAFNRCIDFILPDTSARLFEKKRTYVWIVFMYSYAFCAAFFVQPVVLNSAAIMWTYDAFLIFPQDLVPVNHEDYIAKANDYNNYLLTGAVTLFYAVLVVAIGLKGRGTNQSKLQAHVLTIATLICGLEFIPGFIFILLETIPVTNFMLYLCLFTWQMGTGGGGIIMLIFNKSIRNEVVKMLHGSYVGSTVSGITTAIQVRQTRINPKPNVNQ
uniref:G_PROTEIN_RECEP_F1_2 domain-containing protein n=1 Tax=Steinernema glaseri TaxID=37863 RepID=A0A1I7Y8W4_9BILA